MEDQHRTAALTADEKEHLLHIYKARLKLFVTAYIPVLLFALFLCFQIDYKPRFSKTMIVNKLHVLNEKEHVDNTFSRTQKYLINILLLEAPLLICGYLLIKRRIRPFKLDAEHGQKVLVPYEIIRKSHFPQTGQYFISFSDPSYMHHEVEEEFYNNCKEGEVAYISRAPKSKYVFDKNGRFSLM